VESHRIMENSTEAFIQIKGFFLLPLIAVIALSIALLSCSLSAWQIHQIKKEFRKRKLVLETRWELEEESKNAQLSFLKNGSDKLKVCKSSKTFEKINNDFLSLTKCSFNNEGPSLSKIISSR